jgi:3-oxoacyl-[acyl-carrier protein] reductase
MEKRILITGSSRGIGKAIAEILLSQGYHVTLHGREPGENLSRTMEQFEETFPGKVGVVTFDISDNFSSSSSLEQYVADYGAFWGIVCNAGMTLDATFPSLSYKAWREVLSSNLDAFYHVVHPLLMPMIKLRSGGRIVLISSLSGVTGNRGQVAYSAAKAGLQGAAKALAKDLASRAITVNCIAPGPVETDMISPTEMERMVTHIPMGRACRAEEVAHSVAYLLHDDAAYMTGQTLILAGGLA